MWLLWQKNAKETWHKSCRLVFFTCNTNNRIAAGKCTGMYIQEEEIFCAIHKQTEKEIDLNEMIDSIEEILIYLR